MSLRKFALLSLFFLLCTDPVGHSSPFDIDYSGDYRFGIEISPRHDTAVIFYPYKVSCIDSGSDRFASFSLSTDPSDKMKTVFQKLSPLSLYFTAPFTGELIVTGVRPNDKTDELRNSIIVVNPYRITVDSATLLTGTAVEFRVVNIHAAGATDRTLLVKWNHRGTSSGESLPFDSAFSITMVRPDPVTVFATISDSSDNSMPLDTITIYLPSAVVPAVAVTEHDLHASAGRPCTIVASMENADSLRWRIAGLDTDTVTTTASLTITWPDSLDDTVIVTAKNRFGTSGNSDTGPASHSNTQASR